MTNYHIYIGYDDRETEAYQVAKYSIEKYAKENHISGANIIVHKLEHKPLRAAGLYSRPMLVEGDTGQYVDGVDNRPCSTQFTFTRFLVAELWRRLDDPDKSPLVMFADCDMMWTGDIRDMFNRIELDKVKSRGKAPVYCTQHDYKPQNSIKMDNVNQTGYNMKLWAAMFVLDMDHSDNELLTPNLVNSSIGRDLMNFCWVGNKHSIAPISERWHFIPEHSEGRCDPTGMIHWTEGGPNLVGCRGGKYDKLWDDMYQEYLAKKVLNINFDIVAVLSGD